MDEETELERGQGTFQGPTLRTCRPELRIQVFWILGKPSGPVSWWRTHLPCLKMPPEKTQADLWVRGGVWEWDFHQAFPWGLEVLGRGQGYIVLVSVFT